MRLKHGGDIWNVSREMGLNTDRIRDFSANINPLGPSRAAMEAVKGALGYVGAYPEPEARRFKEALSAYHGLPLGCLLPANGSTELIYLIPRVLAASRALIVEPAFGEYRRALESAGCRVDTFQSLEADGFSIAIESLTDRLKAGYDIVYLANPSNPAGVLTPKEMVVELARECAALGIVIIVDEAFVDFNEAHSVKQAAVGMENVVVLRSMTKFFSLAGLRLGYLIAGEAMVERLARAMAPWSVNTFASIAGCAALEDARHMESTLEWFVREREFMYESLSKVGSIKTFPSAANFFLAKLLTDSVKAATLKEALLDRAILIREVSEMRGLGENFFRVAIRERADNEVLIGAIEEVLEGAVRGEVMAR